MGLEGAWANITDFTGRAAPWIIDPEGFSSRNDPMESALYQGWVVHRRSSPRVHRFRYRVFAALLDLDEGPKLGLKLLGWNRAGLFSFRDRDHGDGRDLRVWLDDLLAQQGIVADGRKSVLCYPRIFGFVFNPLSVWFCHAKDGALKAIVYEVHNTYDERHAYVLLVGHDGALVQHGCEKAFYVSPFLSRDCRYHFRVTPPGAHVAIVIEEAEAGAPILMASFAGARTALSDGALLKMLVLYPLMTLKVVVAIHYEAVRLMLKGVKRHPHSLKAEYAAKPAE
jgi:DUF1365 family protein